jgi:hypothetical protein
MRYPNKKKQPSEKSQLRKSQLIEDSVAAKELRNKFAEKASEEGKHDLAEFFALASVNFMLTNYIYKAEGVEDFKTFKQWGEEGYRVIKGESCIYPIWGRKTKGTAKETNPKEGEDPKESEYKFFPVCFLFANTQVIKENEEQTEEITKSSEVLSEVLQLTRCTPPRPKEEEKIEEAEEIQTPEMIERIANYKAGRMAKADRYRELANKNSLLSTEKCNQAVEMVRVIPMGQPILVGHHSERGHRALLNRSDNAMRKSIEHDSKSSYYENKANNAENNHAIFSDDPEAVQKLKAKLKDLESSRATMKAANVILREKSLNDVQKVEELQELKFTEKQAIETLEPDFMGRVGFAPYVFSNLSGNIRTVKQRIEKLSKQAEEETSERIINGVKLIENTKINRLQLKFDGKPSDEIRADLNKNGFRWSGLNEVWQRHRSTWATSLAESILNSLSV